MRNLNVGLTPEQVAKRRHCIGGSDANILMSGDPKAINDLWLQKTGQAEPVDLSDVLPVVMGSWTEELNLYWYERQTGQDVTSEGKEMADSALPWRTATLDGLTVSDGTEAIFEAKHVNAFSKLDEVVQKYMPQLHHNMAVAGLSVAILSVFKGTFDHEWFRVEYDDLYGIQLLERERKFWACVESCTPPGELPAVKPPEPPTEFREVDMTGNNEWASHAADWLENGPAAKKFDKSVKAIKSLTDDDVSLAYGHGIQIERAKTTH